MRWGAGSSRRSPRASWRWALRIGIRLAILPMLKDEISVLADALGGEGESKGRRGGSKAAKPSGER